MNRIFKLFKDPYWAFGVFLRRVLCRFIRNDRLYIRLDYFSVMKHFPNLKNPQTFNEKLQWLKLNDKHEEYTRLVDKYEVKNYVCQVLGEEFIIPTLGVWNSFDDIDFTMLPNQFVLKATHDSGGIVLVKDKNKLDLKAAKKKLERSLKRNYYYEHREYPYKNVEPRIIAEKLLTDADNHDLKDYKFMCFNGVCKMIFVCSNRSKHNVNVDFFDPQWNHLPFKRHYNNSSIPIQKPRNLEKMISLAEKISHNIVSPFVRIDFYEIINKIYFGEITFFPGAGLEEFTPHKWDNIIGNLLKLPCDE